MTPYEQKHFDFLYQKHLTNLQLQGKRRATIDGYSSAVRRIARHFDRCSDNLSEQEMKQYFATLIQSHAARAGIQSILPKATGCQYTRVRKTDLSYLFT